MFWMCVFEPVDNRQQQATVIVNDLNWRNQLWKSWAYGCVVSTTFDTHEIVGE